MHASDTHLGHSFASTGSFPSSRQQDLLATFGRICDLAIDKQVAALLIAGDFFHGYAPDSGLIGDVQSRFDRLNRAGVRIFIIPGNHDDIRIPGSVWRRAQLTGIELFDQPRFTSKSFQAEGAQFHIHGLAFDHLACDDPLATLIPVADGVNIAMLHATVDPAPNFPVEHRYLPLSIHKIAAAGMDYMALGHIHKQKTFNAEGRLIGCYPGSPEGQDPSETGPRYAALLEFNGGSPRLELCPVNGRTVRRELIDVTNCGAADMATKLEALANRDLLLTVILKGMPEEQPDEDALRQRLADDFFWLRIEDETDLLDAAWVEDIARQYTIQGRFVKTLRERLELATNVQDRARLAMALKVGLVALRKESST